MTLQFITLSYFFFASQYNNSLIKNCLKNITNILPYDFYCNRAFSVTNSSQLSDISEYIVNLSPYDVTVKENITFTSTDSGKQYKFELTWPLYVHAKSSETTVSLTSHDTPVNDFERDIVSFVEVSCLSVAEGYGLMDDIASNDSSSKSYFWSPRTTSNSRRCGNKITWKTYTAESGMNEIRSGSCYQAYLHAKLQVGDESIDLNRKAPVKTLKGWSSCEEKCPGSQAQNVSNNKWQCYGGDQTIAGASFCSPLIGWSEWHEGHPKFDNLTKYDNPYIAENNEPILVVVNPSMPNITFSIPIVIAGMSSLEQSILIESVHIGTNSIGVDVSASISDLRAYENLFKCSTFSLKSNDNNATISNEVDLNEIANSSLSISLVCVINNGTQILGQDLVPYISYRLIRGKSYSPETLIQTQKQISFLHLPQHSETSESMVILFLCRTSLIFCRFIY